MYTYIYIYIYICIHTIYTDIYYITYSCQCLVSASRVSVVLSKLARGGRHKRHVVVIVTDSPFCSGVSVFAKSLKQRFE